ncbi:epoxide hydrolase 1-related [Holotrichia oblita]|uniref:Epoxide hydrolase 1-related n=1 Tax=Holotrichia oblita TaxID=644536 RepID=A0ACB9TYE7_HOLOL|nr:epoxide hydrolase 1-related [Holotrichia oblita]
MLWLILGVSVLIIILIAVFLFYRYIYVPWFQIPALPEIHETWWGAGEENKEDVSIMPFKIHFSEEVIEDLTDRLQRTRTPTRPLQGIQQQYGFNTDTLKTILEYWATKYDWKARENHLNQFPHFRTSIQGLNIHFLHVKPKVPEQTPVIPLLILHGWPGSVVEFYKLIPILTKVHERYGYAFEVIAPSLPGFGFSDGAVKPGLGTCEIALLMKKLMLRIGHETFFVQGGDWGSIIVTAMATMYPEAVLGLHTNMPDVSTPRTFLKILIGSLWPRFVIDEGNEEKLYPLSTFSTHVWNESAYLHMQATKPDTISVGLNDSPAGLAAYILEKFSTGTNKDYREWEDAGLLKKYTYDELIDNLMFYWVPQCFATAARIYAEGLSSRQFALGVNKIPISKTVPCAVAVFPNEIIYYPDWILRDKYAHLVHRANLNNGGHFAAMEVPAKLAEDMFRAMEKMRRLKAKK